MAEWVPPNGCFQHLYPQGSLHCFLPLQESLQEQQVSLAQVPFTFLPLCWASTWVRFCAPVKSGVSVSYSSLALPYTSPTCLQSYTFWELIFPVKDLWAREPDVGLGYFTFLGEPLQLWLSSCFWVTYQGCWSWLYYISIPPTHFLVVPSLYVYLWRIFSASLQVILIDSCFVNGCNFGVLWKDVSSGSPYSAILVMLETG